MDKLLSIIVPSYNMEKYLPKCLGSLVVDDKELLQKLDVIVVNDGSKDRTSEIGHDFERRYPCIFRVIDKQNGNYGSCINAALPTVEGRFVKILDADDTYDTEIFVSYLGELLKLPPEVDMVMNDYVETDEHGTDLKRVTYPLPESEFFTISRLPYPQINLAMHAVAFRTSLLRDIHYVQTEGISYTDTEWFCLPVAASKVICYRKLPVYRYLTGRAGQTMEQATWAKNCWMMEKILVRMVDQINGNSYSPEEHRYIEGQIRRLAACIVYVTFRKPSRSILVRFFRFIHPLVERQPCIKSVLPDGALFVRTPLKFDYVDFLTKHPSFSAPVLILVNCYNRVRKLI